MWNTATWEQFLSVRLGYVVSDDITSEGENGNNASTNEFSSLKRHIMVSPAYVTWTKDNGSNGTAMHRVGDGSGNVKLDVLTELIL